MAEPRDTLSIARDPDLRWLALTTAAAALVRGLFAWLEPTKSWNDSAIYRDSARQLIESGRIDSDLVMPLYPALIGLVGWSRILALQLVLSSACVVLVYLLAVRVFDDRRIARVAALLMAFEPLSIYYANQRLTETLYAFLLLAALLALSGRRYALGSVCFVASILVRPVLDVVGPLLVVVACWSAAERPLPRFAAARVLAYALIYVVMLAPWWWHNEQKYDRFVRANLGDGIVLRVENNDLFVRHGFWGELRPVFVEFDGIKDPIARNTALRQAALGFIAADPWRYVLMSARRAGRFFSPVLDQSEFFASRLARRAGLPLSLMILAAAAAYPFVSKPPAEWRRLAPVLLVIAVLTVVHVATHGIVRYRMPLMPLFTLLAAATLWRAWTWVRAPRGATRPSANLPSAW